MIGSRVEHARRGSAVALGVLLIVLALATVVGPRLRPRAATAAAQAVGSVAVAQSPGTPVRYVVADGSEARYRVREQLVGLTFPNDAVGTTRGLDGHITVDAQGRVLGSDSRIAVDLRALQSDEARRDNYLRRRTLETDRYPLAVLIPREVRRLPVPLPETGTVPFELVGDFTMRDATRRLTWEGTATFQGPSVRVLARTAFRFGDFGLSIPRVSVVLSVEDHIRLEADLVLRRSP